MMQRKPLSKAKLAVEVKAANKAKKVRLPAIISCYLATHSKYNQAPSRFVENIANKDADWNISIGEGNRHAPDLLFCLLELI